MPELGAVPRPLVGWALAGRWVNPSLGTSFESKPPMTIMRDGKDVTQEILARAESLRSSPHGRRQRDALFGVLTKAILAIEEIPPPWLDDCIENARAAVVELRNRIPHE